MSNQEYPTESFQRPRLGYDILTDEGLERRELPFVLGIVGDFSGPVRSPKSRQDKWQVHDVTLKTFGVLTTELGVEIDLPQLRNELPGENSLDRPDCQPVHVWCELYRLASRASTAEDYVHIRLIDISKQQLAEDLCKSPQDSELYSILYEKVFGLPEGEPYSMMLVDFEFAASELDCKMLLGMSRMGQLTFCPFVSKAASALFEPRSGNELEGLRHIASWNVLRESEESGFLALTVPPPLQADGVRASSSLFAYAYIWLERVIQRGWFWGVGSPIVNCETDPQHYQPGFIVAPFERSGSTERTMYEPAEQTSSFPIDSFHGKLPVMLSCCRFMQYLLVICRDSIGYFNTSEEIEMSLMRWLYRYVGVDGLDIANEQAKIQMPLFGGRVEIKEQAEPYSVRLQATLQPYAPAAELPNSFTFACQLPTQN